ncbi:MAG TPA: manganese efflux pump MntP family protein [Clostridia bacterium]|nr:manganese efflux pump MntP family protein [Clostridia bacterium]
MTLWELLLIAVGLSMDAFAVAICKGLSLKKITWKEALTVGLYFGGFQAAMPIIGYFIGTGFSSFIQKWDHWIAFILLAIIGFKMIIESLKKSCDINEDTDSSKSLSLKRMLTLAIGTSIDALAVGVTFAFLSVNIIPAVSFIGIITLILSFVGVYIGNYFGCKFKSKAELAGGIILVLMGTKILLNHLEIISF